MHDLAHGLPHAFGTLDPAALESTAVHVHVGGCWQTRFVDKALLGDYAYHFMNAVEVIQH